MKCSTHAVLLFAGDIFTIANFEFPCFLRSWYCMTSINFVFSSDETFNWLYKHYFYLIPPHPAPQSIYLNLSA